MNELLAAMPATQPLPATGTIDLWWLPYIPGCDLHELARQTLVSEELLRAERFKVEHARQAFIFYRVALRSCLARYAGIEPREVPLGVGPFGKPLWERSMNGVQLEFNLSHTSTCGLLAVASSGEVGVDVEQLDSRTNVTLLAREILSAAEKSYFAALAESEQAAFLLQTWTCKEAFLKARGLGLAVSLHDITIKSGREIMVANDPQEDGSGWQLASWSPQLNLFAAVAYRGEVRRIHELDAASLLRQLFQVHA